MKDQPLKMNDTLCSKTQLLTSHQKDSNTKEKLDQLLEDTKSIIRNISKHDKDPILDSLKNDFENAQSALCKSTKADKKRTTFEEISNANASIPWEMSQQNETKKFFAGECDKNMKTTTKHPMIRHSVTIPINKCFTPSLNYTNMQKNTVCQDLDIEQVERELDRVQTHLNSNKKMSFSPRKIKEFHSPKRKSKQIEVVGIDIPLKQFYLKQSDYTEARQNLQNKLNKRMTKKDINRIFKENDQRMDINEFNQRLNKVNNINLSNVELKLMNDELKNINDDIYNDSDFDKQILTKFLTKPVPKPKNVEHGLLTHLDSTLTMAHPYQVKLRNGTNTPMATASNVSSANLSPQKRSLSIGSGEMTNYFSKYNQYITTKDFINGGSAELYQDDENAALDSTKSRKRFIETRSSQLTESFPSSKDEDMFKGLRKKSPKNDDLPIYMSLKVLRTKVRRKKMIRGKCVTNSKVQIKALPLNYKHRYKSGKVMAKKVKSHQLCPCDDNSITPIDRELIPSAGMYQRK